MTTCIALLRAVNVGGTTKIAMADLRAMAAELGLGEPRTLLQSGNLVFTSKDKPAALETLLERETARRLGLTTAYLVRSAREWDAIVAANPFPKEAKSDPSHLVAMPLKEAPPAAAVKALQEAIKGPEIVRLEGRTLYATYPAGIGTSKLTIAVIEKKLATVGTGRNWNTVLKLAALASA